MYLWYSRAQVKSRAEPLVKFTMDMVEKYNGKHGSVVNFGSGTGLTSLLLSKDFEKVAVICE